ncbi:MAG: arsenate reductase ArsC [Bacillota bacterium]|nr:arsenate reductase ArsC [Bacillota bacterium]
MLNILFVCTANSVRSQMAEGLARVMRRFDGVMSAGTEPTTVNPLAVEAMREIGIDISAQRSKPLTPELLAWADVLITLCGDARDRCPLLPPGKRHLHWGIDDPAAVTGSRADRLDAFRRTRDTIRKRLDEESTSV